MSLPVALNPDGSPAGLNLDNSGNLKCAVTGAGSGGTSSVDQATFTAGTSAGTPLMAEDPTSGQLLIAQMSPGTRQLAIAGSFSSTPPSSNTASAVAQTTVSTSSASILASNGSRKACSVQNTGTTVIKLGLGKTPTQTAYHIALPASGSADDGSSRRWDGTISGVVWTGAINAISSASGGACVVTELT
ncbi:MAG: hypothetical protein JO345_21970 [Streptosporangiaceae bacterium]|nr:hypothetical protein [Streptosporangiaceae bacterium]